MYVEDIINIMNRLAPENIAEEWDNVGLQIGSRKNRVEKILLSLDIDKNTIDIAEKEKYDMIITHHPLIFEGLKTIDYDSFNGYAIQQLIRNNITVYSAHTNLDKAKGGVNDIICDKLGLKEIENLIPSIFKEETIGRIGKLADKKRLQNVAKLVRENLECDYINVYGEEDRYIENIAVVGGSGGSMIGSAIDAGIDLFITGDVKYHDAQEAVENGISIIDAGHYNTEKHVLNRIKEYLELELEEKTKIKIKINKKNIYKARIYKE